MADIVNAAIQGRAQGYNELQGFSEDLARKRAGRSLAGGDRAAAAQELYGAGMIDAGRTLERDGRQEMLENREIQQQDRTLADNERKQRADFLKQAATVLRQIPADQRAQAYTGQIAPALKAMGMDEAMVTQVADHLDDNSLNTFIGEIDNQMKMFNTPSGVVGVTPQGEAKLLYQDPLAQDYKRAQIAATQARAGASQASAAATRQRAARGPGGGRAAANPAAKLPSGFILD